MCQLTKPNNKEIIYIELRKFKATNYQSMLNKPSVVFITLQNISEIYHETRRIEEGPQVWTCSTTAQNYRFKVPQVLDTWINQINEYFNNYLVYYHDTSLKDT